MIGKVTWVGHITCYKCCEQIVDIHWGEARKTLRKAGWRAIPTCKDGRPWLCHNCYTDWKSAQSLHIEHRETADE